MGCHFLLQGIYLTQGSNWGLLHCRWLLYHLSYQESPMVSVVKSKWWKDLIIPKWKWSHSVMFDSSRPRELQPTKLLHPWESPGKSTGVGHHCLLQQSPKSLQTISGRSWTPERISALLLHVSIGMLCNPMDYSLPGSSIHGILQARVLEWVAIPLLQGIFLTQGSKPGLPHCKRLFYDQGNPNYTKA